MSDERAARIAEAEARARAARAEARALDDHLTLKELVGDERAASELRARRAALLTLAERHAAEARSLGAAAPAVRPRAVAPEPGAPARELQASVVEPAAPGRARVAAPAGARARDEGAVGAGPRLLGLYEVRGVLGEGGMGRVLCVHHPDWDLDLALKIPTGRMTARERERVVAEADAWAGLGLHPHVVTCYFASEVEGVPWIFAELVEGGSLAAWIADRRLYRGEAPLARLLDVARESALGLDHAHACGLVHQDMKPGNVLMTADGTAKVTDFGLARAGSGGGASDALRAALDGAGGGAGQTLAATFAGMTPAYCSPEQAAVARGLADAKITRRSDLWSWAATVLECFTGRLTWRAGPDAGKALAAYRPPPDLPPMPAELAALLARAFELDEARRPASLREVADAIAGFYERVTGRRPPRERRAYYDGADELYNRGTSLLALGAHDKALACYERALATDPQHFLAAYGRTVLRWRAGRLTDVEAVRQVEDARQFVALRSRGFAASQAPRAQATEALAGLHAERGAAGAADGLVAEARATRRKLTPSLDALGQSLVNGIEPGKMFRTHERAAGYALAEDGRRVAALGVDSAGTATLVRWDLGVQRATARSPLPGVGELRGVALARDGKRALAVGSGAAFLWDEVADVARALPGTAGAVAGALSPDGARVAFAFADRVVHETLGGARRELAYAGARAVFLSSRPDEVLALGPAELAWLDANGRPRLVVGGVRAAAWQDDGLVCFLARRDAAGRSLLEARAPAVAEARWSHVLPEPQAAIAVSPDGGTLVTVAEDGTFRRWDARVGRCRTTAPMGFALPPRAILVGRAGFAPALVDAEGKLHGYTLPRELPRATFPILRPTRSEELLGRQERVEAALAAARARVATDVPAAAALLERMLQTPWIARLPEVRALWQQVAARSAKGEIVAAWPSSEIAAASAPVVAVELAADGAHVVSACARGEGVSVWSAQTGERLRRMHEGVPVTGLALAELRDVLAVATPGEVTLWDWRLGRALRSMPELAGARSVALSASGHRLAVARGPDVEVWDVATGALLGRIAQAAGPAAGAEVRRVALDAAGASVLVAASSGLFRRTLAGPAAAGPFPASVETLDVALSACDGWALSGSQDGTLRLWTVDGVGVYRAASEHALTGVAMSHDRRLAVTVDARGVAAVWSFPDAERLAVLSGHAGPATDVAMTPSGRHAATAGQDGRVRVWTLEWSLDPFPRSDHDASARAVVSHLVSALGQTATGDDAARRLAWAALGHYGPAWAARLLATVRGAAV